MVPCPIEPLFPKTFLAQMLTIGVTILLIHKNVQDIHHSGRLAKISLILVNLLTCSVL